MAAPLSLLLDFTGGQGAGADYITYAQDLDSNFTAIQSTVNSLVEEVTAVQGPNAVLGLDVMRIDDAAGSGGAFSGNVTTDGLVGAHSLFPTINAGNIDLTAGTLIVGGQRLAIGAAVVVPTTDGTRFIAISASGSITVETAAAQSDLDLYQVTVSGGAFTSIDARLVDVFFDGDQYQELLVRPAQDSLPASTFEKLSQRILDLETLLGGITTSTYDPLGSGTPATLGPLIVPGGTASLPGLVFGDGAGSFDADTGFAQLSGVGANSISVMIGGEEVGRWDEAGATNQYLADDITVVTNPAYSFLGDTDTGIFHDSANQLGFAVGGVVGMTLVETGGVAQLELSTTGSASAPEITWAGDTNTGIFWFAADAIGFATGSGTRVIMASAGLRINVDGSAATPSIGWQTDTGFDTGFFRDAEDELAVACGGVEVVRWAEVSAAARVGFLGATPAVRQNITGSRGGNAALASLLTGLATLGLITDSTSA